MNFSRASNNHGKPMYPDRNDYINAITVLKEGKAEIEYRSLGRYKWAKVYLVLNDTNFIVYQSDSKTFIRNRWEISAIDKTEPVNSDSHLLVVKIKDENDKRHPIQDYRFRFSDASSKDEWFSEFGKVILVNSKNSTVLKKFPSPRRGTCSDDEQSFALHQSFDDSAMSSPTKPRIYNHRGSWIEPCLLDEEELLPCHNRGPSSITDEEIRSLINEAKDYFFSHQPQMDSPSILLESGCAVGISYKNKKRQNEDRIFVNTCIDFSLRHGTVETDVCRESRWSEYQKGIGKALFAIFDGHNGDYAAKWCSDHLLECYLQCYSDRMSSSEVLEQVIRTLEERLKDAMNAESIAMGGCTCVLVYLNNNKLTVANVGDTQAFLAKEKDMIELTEIHDAFNDQQRICQAGGWITTLKEEVRTRLGSIVSPSSSSSTSPIPFVSTGGTPVETVSQSPFCFNARVRNCKYFVNGELEVARSLGDFYLKLPRLTERPWRYPTLPREQLGVSGFVEDVVSSVPHIKQCKIKADDRFIIIATDGLWEVINPRACISIVTQLADQHSLKDVCVMLFWISQQRGSYDNTSIIIVDLRHLSVASLY